MGMEPKAVWDANVCTRKDQHAKQIEMVGLFGLLFFLCIKSSMQSKSNMELKADWNVCKTVTDAQCTNKKNV